MPVPPLHAAHQVRETFDSLQLLSWLAVGAGAGALVLTWGRLLAWLRTPDAGGAQIVRWGEDHEGLYFELRNTHETTWTLETDGPAVALQGEQGRTVLLRGTPPEGSRPVALRSAGGARLPL